MGEPVAVMPAFQPCTCRLHRRRFLQLAGGAAFATAFPAAADAQVLETQEMPTLLLICNEAAVWPPANDYMKSRQLSGGYEPVEVEGASIGLVADQYKEMREAFWAKLIAAAAFQQTRRVIALNHRGCAAMKIAYGLNKISDKLIETETHRYALQEFRRQMAERLPDVEVETGLIDFDGKVEILKPQRLGPSPASAKPKSSSKAKPRARDKQR
jgi:hypothetical protein